MKRESPGGFWGAQGEQLRRRYLGILRGILGFWGELGLQRDPGLRGGNLGCWGRSQGAGGESFGSWG